MRFTTEPQEIPSEWAGQPGVTITGTVITPWPTLDEYVLARPCPTCQAPIGTDCTRRGGGRHARRLDRAIAHANKDKWRAPWIEERISGRRYDTLPGGPQFADEADMHRYFEAHPAARQ
ncbi:MAG TPA: hypothetical protein VGD67_13705 [Pseudonocardiaceae bacterium]